MTQQPAMTVIVVNWNARAYLPACLDSLLGQAYPDYEVALVDNASTDGSVAMVRRRYPQVRVLEQEENKGFAAGNNAAIREARGEIIVLANPDIVAEPDMLAQLAAVMEKDATVGIAGCKVFYPDGRLQHAGGVLPMPQAIASYRGYLEADQGQYDGVADVDYVIGAALAIRRGVAEEVGLLDEGFFMYYEEADWCARARRQGFRVVYVPQAQLTHVESATTPKEDSQYLRRFHRSRWRYLLKHAPLDTLLSETMPAEMAWLGRINRLEKAAVADAYLRTVQRLVDIMAARTGDGNTAFSYEGQVALFAGLRRLRDMAWRVGGMTEAPELERWQVREPAFTSNVPLLGGAIS